MSYETSAAHFIWNPLGSSDCSLRTLPASIFEARCALHRALDRATTEENEDEGKMEGRDRAIDALLPEKEPASSYVSKFSI